MFVIFAQTISFLMDFFSASLWCPLPLSMFPYQVLHFTPLRKKFGKRGMTCQRVQLIYTFGILKCK